MGIKWRKFSHASITKIIVFLLAVFCFAVSISIFVDNMGVNDGDYHVVLEDSYYRSNGFVYDCDNIVVNLLRITKKYQNEEHILSGASLSEEELEWKEQGLFEDFEYNSRSYNPNLSREENYQVFREIYAERIDRMKEQLIKEDLREFQLALRGLDEYKGVVYYAKIGANELTNSTDKTQDYFQSLPAYILLDSSEFNIYPEEIKGNRHYHWLRSELNDLDFQDVVYVGFTKEFLNPRMAEWQNNKNLMTNSLNQTAGYFLGFIITFICLLLVIGRKPEEEDKVHFTFIDRLYNDINICLCFLLIGAWSALVVTMLHYNSAKYLFPLTIFLAACGLLLVLSLVKHLKNRTFIKHSLTYKVFHKVFSFFKDVYNSGSVAVKTIVIVIGYPLIVAATFFMFPVTIGLAAWFSLKKVKEFNAIKEGVQRVKSGDLLYSINITGEGELVKLAADINSVTDGLNKAVEVGVKSERLKTELITNVSHDIRTPLTSIITYVDLLKQETNPAKVQEYVEVIDQKSQRLKVLTDDLFEASKASSGSMPVNLERIDLVSLITQALGEVDEKIQERKLDFKLSLPQEKVLIQADGRLLSRAIENLLSNIFKYALEGSRVYVDINDLGTRAELVIKNISAYELNIPAEELLKRFTRGDEARTGQGSGLGLSIAKSLVELQKGSFNLEIDGDLFKAIIRMSKAV